MDNFYRASKLYYYEFQHEDLEDNVKDGLRNQTGYKVPALEVMSSTFFPSEEKGIIPILTQNDFSDKNLDINSFYVDSPILLETSTPYEGTTKASNHNLVLVELEDFLCGPYVVKSREGGDERRYIRPEITKNKHIVRGYKKNSVKILDYTFGYYSNQETIRYVVEDTSLQTCKDVMYKKKDLLEYFLASIKESMYIKDGKISVDDFRNLANEYENSLLSDDIPHDVVKERLNKLVNFLTSEEELDDTLKYLTEVWCDLIEKHQNSEAVTNFINHLVEDNPELLDNLKESELIFQRNIILENLDLQILQKKNELKDVNESQVNHDAERTLKEQSEEFKLKQKEYELLIQQIEELSDVKNLQATISDLQAEKRILERDNNVLKDTSDNLQLSIQNYIKEQKDQMVSIAFNGFVANQLTTAAGSWQTDDEQRNYDVSLSSVNNSEVCDMEPENLIKYLVETIQTVRPKYEENDIINIAICVTQGFLTIFSGEPGSGKTSFCNIWAEVLGLNSFNRPNENNFSNLVDNNRYIPISVGRGWTSKRDFIGYFNPLTKKFDKTNAKMFDSLKILSLEKEKDINKFPLYVLLDEANLSPMEYYWADFMNVCDKLDDNSIVNLTEDYIFRIPETLHFLATINNDHTTEILSPRLIDRSWIISLPQMKRMERTPDNLELDSSILRQVSWKSLKTAFLNTNKTSYKIENIRVLEIYQEIIDKLWTMKIQISTRTRLSVERYLSIASIYMKDNDNNTTERKETIALDYAIAQRILPKISGSGESFRAELEKIADLCAREELEKSARLLGDILLKGDKQMKYYRFF